MATNTTTENLSERTPGSIIKRLQLVREWGNPDKFVVEVVFEPNRPHPINFVLIRREERTTREEARAIYEAMPI